MAGTPTSRILETIALAERMQVQIDDLIADVDTLSARIEVLERMLAALTRERA